MAINPIIKKQSVKIDDHLWGVREEKDWDKKDRDIHLDKRTLTRYNGKNINVTIKIPLNSERKIQVFSKNDNFEDIPRELRKEIENAFEDVKLRKNFYSDISSVLENYKSHLTNENKATQALTKIAQAFGLDWDNLIRLSFNKKQRNKYYAEISDEEDIYQLTINEKYITAKDTMRKKIRLKD